MGIKKFCRKCGTETKGLPCPKCEKKSQSFGVWFHTSNRNNFKIQIVCYITNVNSVERLWIALGKRQVKNEKALKEIKLPETDEEMFGRVIKMMGGENLMVKCQDKIVRVGRIRGKLKRRVWIRDNDVVIIAPWEFGKVAKGDILWRYTLPQVEWLKQNKHIPLDF